MKRLLPTLCAAALCLSLTACGKPAAPFDPVQDAQTLLDSGAFSEVLTPLDQDVACALYGIDQTAVTACAVYASPGATAEELALFTFSSQEEAEAAVTLLGYRVEDRREELENYLPNELPKLDKAVIQQREASLLLVVATDYSPVETFLKG